LRADRLYYASVARAAACDGDKVQIRPGETAHHFANVAAVITALPSTLRPTKPLNRKAVFGGTLRFSLKQCRLQIERLWKAVDALYGLFSMGQEVGWITASQNRFPLIR
jgi:hypothetical protein